MRSTGFNLCKLCCQILQDRMSHPFLSGYTAKPLLAPAQPDCHVKQIYRSVSTKIAQLLVFEILITFILKLTEGRQIMQGGKNLKHKIMSLSALGAGALVFGAGRADATIITSGVIDYEVMKGSSPYSSGSLGPLGATFSFNVLGRTVSTAYKSVGYRLIKAAGKQMFFEGTAKKLSVTHSGVIWKAGKLGNAAVNVGSRKWTNYFSAFAIVNGSGNATFADQCALFRFKTGSSTWDYGWIELSYTVSDVRSKNPTNDPNLTIVSWAYDNTGVFIAAGVGDPPTPEPGTLFSTGLAALAMGAVGLRRWRKARQSA